MRRKGLPLIVAVGCLAVLLLLGGLALALTASGVRTNLDTSRKALVKAQKQFTAGDTVAAGAQLTVAARRSHDAVATTHGVLWKLYSHVPIVSSGVQEVRGVADALDVTNHQVLPLLLSAQFRRTGWNGRVDAAPFLEAQVPLAKAEAVLVKVRGRLAAAPRSKIDVVHTARARLETGLTSLYRTVVDARVAADAVPALVGGTKTYLLAIQNNAEQRATGGLLGAYGLLQVVDGRLSLTEIGPNQDLADASAPVLELGREFDDRYQRFDAARVWRSANLTPDTPTACRILAALWKQRTGVALDGVVMVDPVALARILGATGPVTLHDGTSLTQQNAVPVLLAQAYERFPEAADAARNSYLQDAARKAIAALTSRHLSGRKVASRLGTALGSGHLQLWSSEADVQSVLERSTLSGVLSASGPFLEVVTQDVGGSKLGYYLRRAVRYEGSPTGSAVDLGSGPVAEERATVSVSLANDAPARLPDYVTIRADDPAAPRGQSKSWVSIYLGHDATLMSATLDGRPVVLESGTEKGLSVFSTFVTVDRGATSRLVLNVRQPARRGQALVYRQQPLLADDDLVVKRGDAPLDLVYER